MSRATKQEAGIPVVHGQEDVNAGWLRPAQRWLASMA